MLFLFGKLKLKRWRTYSNEMKCRIFQSLENKFAKKQFRRPENVVVNYDSRFKSAGMFCNSESGNIIYLNPYYITDNERRFAALYTILHEGRHATQYEKAVAREPRWYEFTKRRWRTNWNAYVGSNEDPVMYENQVLERDADGYAIKMMNRLRFKYRKEKDFKQILQARVEKFEKDEKLAMERSGLFAKWIIHWKIRNRAKKRHRQRF